MPNDYFHLELYELDANARLGRGARDSIEEDSAGNNYRNIDLCVLPMHIDEVSGKAPSMHPSFLKTILQYLRKPSPLSFARASALTGWVAALALAVSAGRTKMTISLDSLHLYKDLIICD